MKKKQWSGCKAAADQSKCDTTCLEINGGSWLKIVLRQCWSCMQKRIIIIIRKCVIFKKTVESIGKILFTIFRQCFFRFDTFCNRLQQIRQMAKTLEDLSCLLHLKLQVI